MSATLSERAASTTGQPRQIGAVGIGLGILGLASFVYLSLSGRALGPQEFAPLGTLWVLINAAGPALFQPLEQELGRGISHARELGHGARPLFLRGAAIACGLVVVSGLVLLAGHEPLQHQVFGDQPLLGVALFAGLVGLAWEYTSRGAFAGDGAFGRYGAQLAVDGTLRLVGCLVLVALGSRHSSWYGLVLGLAPLLAAILTTRRLGPALTPGPPDTVRRVASALALLTVGSILSQVVINAPAVVATLVAGPTEQARAGVFVSVFVLARIPLFLFAAVQATFLPSLATLAARDDRRGFLRRIRVIAGALGGIGLLGLVAVLSMGPSLVELVYGPAFQTSRAVLWPLAAGAALFMLAAAISQSLISIRAYASSLSGWLVGTAVFAGMLTLSSSLELRIGLAFFAGTAAAAVAQAAGLALRVRHPLV